MSDLIYRQAGNCFIPTPGALTEHKELPPGSYTLSVHDERFHLVAGADITAAGKLYGSVNERSNRVITSFLQRPGITTGVLLEGEPGTGKTVLAKRIIEQSRTQHKIPTIQINEPYGGDVFNRLISDISQPAVVFIDEAEKVYDEPESQNRLLTLLDGTYSTHKLFIIVVNDSEKLVNSLKDRPGRLHYRWIFKRLEAAVIREYVADNLKNQANAHGLFRMMEMLQTCTFDILKALVWEMNQYNEKASVAARGLNLSLMHSLTYMATVTGMPGSGFQERVWKNKSVGMDPFTRDFSITLEKDPSAADLALNLETAIMRQALHQKGGSSSYGAVFLGSGPSASGGSVGSMNEDEIRARFNEEMILVRMDQSNLINDDPLEGTYEFQNQHFLVQLHPPRTLMSALESRKESHSF